MSPLEKRLARRIHNQRVRLRELERIEYSHREYRIWSRSMWFDMAVSALKENRELRDKFGVSESFDQMAAVPDYAASRATARDKLWKRT